MNMAVKILGRRLGDWIQTTDGARRHLLPSGMPIAAKKKIMPGMAGTPLTRGRRNRKT